MAPPPCQICFVAAKLDMVLLATVGGPFSYTHLDYFSSKTVTSVCLQVQFGLWNRSIDLKASPTKILTNKSKSLSKLQHCGMCYLSSVRIGDVGCRRSGAIICDFDKMHCGERTLDASFKERPLTPTSQIGSRKVYSEHPDDT
jgi:hypothetical protein